MKFSPLLWVVVTLVSLRPVTAAAQTAQTWGELRLPGGLAAARQLVDTGTIGGRSDARWLVDAIRRLQGPTESTEGINRLRAYLKYVEELAPLVQSCPEQCRLVPRSAPSAERDRIRRLIDALGLERRDGDQRVELRSTAYDQRTHAWLGLLGVNAAALVETLNKQAPVDIKLVDGRLPLPLPDYFRQAVFRSGTSDFMAIVGDRKVAWFYAALMSCDEGTLRMLATNPSLLRQFHLELSAPLVVAGRTLRLRSTRVETPGDSGAVAVWEALVGRKVTDVYLFTRDLLARDSGRLAYFYSVVAQLDETRQAFVLGKHVAVKDRVPFVDRIYRQFASLDSGWVLEIAPFLRPDFDPQVVFALVDVTDQGTIGPAWWPSLLERALGDSVWDDTPDRTLRALEDQPADALWLISWVFAQPTEAAQRFRMVRSAQRLFAGQPRSAAPAVGVALASVLERPVLHQSLERLGVRDPGVHELMARARRSLVGDSDRDLAHLDRWQRALALFEQIQRRTVLDDVARTRMLTALASVASLPDAQRPGAVGAWVTDVLLPAYGPPDVRPDHRDQGLMEAFIGSPAQPPMVNWEGLEYAFSPAAVEIRSALAILRAARVPGLFDIAALHRLRRQLEAPVNSTGDVQAIVERLKELTDAVDALRDTEGQPAKAVEEFAEIVNNLLRLTTRPNEVARASREVAALRRVIDAVTDAALGSLAYALATVPTGDAPEMFATRWTRHFVTPADARLPRHSAAWQLARSALSPSGGTVLRGSWLGLDLALAESRLRRVGVPLAASAAAMGDSERMSILNRVAVPAPGPLDSGGFEAVVKGVAAGRARLAAWTTTAPDDHELEMALSKAGVAAEDTNAVRWLARRSHPAAFAAIGPSALYALGSTTPLPHGWGAVSVPADGCWCAIRVPPGGTSAMGGRRGAGLGVSLDSDLTVRLAELLAAVRLPAATWAAVLPFALQDWVDSVRQFSPEDSESITVWPRQLTAARLEQYLLMLVADGVFASPKGGVRH